MQRDTWTLVASMALFCALAVTVQLLPTHLDERALAALAAVRHPEGVAAALAITRLGGAGGAIFMTLLLVVALLVLRRPRAAAFLTSSVAGAGALNTWLKWLFGRARPDGIVTPVYAPLGLSFPSGHAMLSFALFVGLWLVARQEQLGRPRAVAVFSAGMVFAVGFTRPYLGVHYVSDVLAGWAVSAAWLVLMRRWYMRAGPRLGEPFRDTDGSAAR